MGHIELFIGDFHLQGKVGGFLIELAEVGDLPSQSPVIKVLDFVLQVCQVATGPEEEGAEPGGDRFDRVFLTMPNHVSLCI